MKIKYLGTSAAEAIPAPFCKCEVCKKARKLGGKEIRTRSQALIDGKLMIDFPSDTYMHSLSHNIELSDIHHYLITHTHPDHFYRPDIHLLKPACAKLPDNTAPYNFYGGSEMAELLEPAAANPVYEERLTVHSLEPFTTYDIGGYKVTPLKANHGSQTPLIYIIESHGKTMLYAHDTGPRLEETWEYLLEKKPYFDLISWDCCKGNSELANYGSHLHMGFIRDIVKRLEENGISDSKTKHCVSHFSHNGDNVLYADREVYEKQGYIMAYDGMEIEF